jgi:cysteinyl-tRNA synthetase
MALQIYNTLTKKNEVFEPLKKGVVTMYNCGPTVYSTAHIGNFASYLMADLIRRYLEYKGLEVKQVMNITDVGHLTSDSDTGEDKMEKAAREEKLDPYEIARKYEELFQKDRKKLRIKDAMEYPRATEHISEQIEIVKKLVDDGVAYETSDGIYFDVTKFPKYGKLSGNKLEDLESGARVEINEDKKHPADFALWKKCVGENENHIMRWESPWGDGFPGWHIECTAMSMKYLGESIDIHTGGEDNTFPHHECEIAQSESFTGKPFVKYWLHRKHILVDGEKMSKSKGNFYVLRDLEDKGYSPIAFRYAMMSIHYRQQANFTFKSLEDAQKSIDKLQEFVFEIKEKSLQSEKDETDSYRKKFEEFLDDDLNVSGALSVVFDLMKDVRNDSSRFSSDKLLDFLKDFNSIFDVLSFEDQILTEDIEKKIKEREDARKNKDFEKSDRIRDELLKEGIELMDTPDGVTWRLKNR